MRIVAPDDSWMFSAVAGTPNAGFSEDWLVDGRPNFPVEWSGSALTVTPSPSLMVDVVAVWGHNIIQGATITLGGSLSGTIGTETWPRDGIPHGWFKLLPTPVSVATATLAVSGNGDDPVVSEFYGGLSVEYPDFQHNVEFDPSEPFEWEGEGLNMNPLEVGISGPRRISGTITLDDTGYEELKGMNLSTRRGARPVLLIEDDSVNDAMLVQLRWTARHNEGNWDIGLEVLEISRPEWP
jgi:hypothetical protein